jgi:CMP-N-acetylneuraminic acid synthetase
MFAIDRTEAWDIDDEVDFVVGEFLYKRMKAAG